MLVLAVMFVGVGLFDLSCFFCLFECCLFYYSLFGVGFVNSVVYCYFSLLSLVCI